MSRPRHSLSLFITLCVAIFTVSSVPVHAQQRQALATHAAAPAGAQLIGRLPASQQMQLAISLPLRNQDQLNTFLQQLEDPTSSNYHHYLSSAQFTGQYGPTVEQYQQVITFVQAHGFTVTHTSPSRQLLNITGPVSLIEQTFQVTMQVYQDPKQNRTYFAPSVDPTVDAGLPILGVSGLTNRVLPHPMLEKASPKNGPISYQTGSGPGGQFLGSDFRAAYYGSGPLTGSGQALALAEFNVWNLADVQAYFSPSPNGTNQTNNVPIITELLGGTNGTCPGACDDGEEANDIIQIVSMAPGASALAVYTDNSNTADVDIFDAYATENIAKQMSMSFGIGTNPADDNYFKEFQAQGQNLFIASGDAGPNKGDGGWPGFSPDITDVGGTALTTNGPGGAWLSEVGWGPPADQGGGGSGTGWCDPTITDVGPPVGDQPSPCNGFSSYDQIPSWQAPSIITAAGGTTKYRNVPDVSADANTDSWYCAAGTCQGGLGGTSLAAPRWAGFLALANEQAAANGEAIGFLSPLAWTIGQGSGYDTSFHDITAGTSVSAASIPSCCTGSFSAMTGFDMVTGWGTPNGDGTINTMAPTSTTNPYFTLSASPATLNLTPGGAPGTATISLTAGNSFSGTIDLSAVILGSPTGVTASFNPTSISGSQTSTLTVSTTSSTPSGTQMLVVTGTSSGVPTGTVYVTLALPDFSLSVTPTNPPAYTGEPNSIYLNQGGSATATVTVNSQNGFSGSVDLAVSGQPTGVTATFNPTSTATTSQLTLAANSTAATGTDYLAVTGASGSITGPLNAPYTILAVSAASGTGGSGTPVSLASAYNLPAIYADGITFGTGMDGGGYGYSANLLTPGNQVGRILNGVQFNLGPASTQNCSASAEPACTNDAVSFNGQTISLPSGQFTTLQLLATAFDGPITGQTITVTYSDGTTSTFIQGFSDWCGCSTNPGGQSGEFFSVVMPYRDEATGAEDNRVFNLYAYTFVLNSAKTVQSLTLPAKPSTGGVVIFAATLTSQNLGTQVSISSAANIAGLFNYGVTFEGTGDIDGPGTNDSCTLSNGCTDAFWSGLPSGSGSGQGLGLTATTSPALTIKGLVFNLQNVNTANCGPSGGSLPLCTNDIIQLPSAPGITIDLPTNQQSAYTTLTMLGTGVQGSHTGTVTVNYTTGTPTTFNQTFSDWCNFGNNTYESVAVGGMYRINSDGTLSTQASCNLYAYTYTLDSTRTASSITLTNTDGTTYTFAVALTLSGNASGSGGSFSLAASPTSGSITAGSSLTSTITVTPSAGYSGTVALSCSVSPTVSGATTPTCSFGSTSPVTITNGAAATATLTFTTIGPSPMIVHTASSGDRNAPPARGQFSRANILYGLIWMPVSGLVLMGFTFGRRTSKRTGNWAALLMLWLVMTGMILLPSCGSGSGSSTTSTCTSAPTTPTGLSASGTTSTGTTLNWTASSATSPCAVTGYAIYQNGTQVGTTTNTTYNVTGLASGNQYSFTVAATDSNGSSAQSSAVTVSTGTQAQTYTLTITGTGSGGATQTGNSPTVTVTVTQ
jgi:hypothetical protein